MSYTVAFAPEAEAQLLELYDYLATKASPDIAAHFVDRIIAYCESLNTFPSRGTMRDDIRPGLRITSYRRRAAIAFYLEGETVYILGVFYGGQSYEAMLLESDQD